MTMLGKSVTSEDTLTSEDASTANQPDRTQAKDHTRAQASMIDFAGAMLLRVVGYMLLVLAGTVLIMFATGPGYADYVTASHAADRRSDDLLVETPNEPRLNRTCTRAFFEQESPGDCGFDQSWATDATDDGAYLDAALAVESTTDVNVTVRVPSGSIITLDTVPLALGQRPPEEATTVRTWERHVGLDTNDDGTVEYATVEVIVW